MPALLPISAPRSAISQTCSAECRRCETTAIAELRRGVSGDPTGWMTATGIVPKRIEQMTGKRPATIQDKWFCPAIPDQGSNHRKPRPFWVVSGFIALVISYDAAAEILRSHGFPPSLSAGHDSDQPDGISASAC